MPRWTEEDFISIVKSFSRFSKKSKLREENVVPLFDENTHSYILRILLCVHHFMKQYIILHNPNSCSNLTKITKGVIVGKYGHLTPTIMDVN